MEGAWWGVCTVGVCTMGGVHSGGVAWWGVHSGRVYSGVGPELPEAASSDVPLKHLCFYLTLNFAFLAQGPISHSETEHESQFCEEKAVSGE